jgi:putative ABC transport system substrate-binding protein
MKRREFIGLLGGAAAWPLAARAQQPARTIGYLGATSSSAETYSMDRAFVRRLRELGWIEGGNIALEYQLRV